MRILAVVALSVSSGCSPEQTASWPEDSSAAGIAAYLGTEAHRAAPWQAETAQPRPPADDVSPHDRVRVFFNDVLLDSQAAGNGAFEGTAHPAGAMAVKELFDADDASLGAAVMLKIDGVAADWVYYCDGPLEVCGVSAGSAPVWGVGTDTECGFCHGGLVFNTL